MADDAPQLLAHLSHQLARLLAMRDASARLLARDQLGRDFFPRGEPEIARKPRETLDDLVLAYLGVRARVPFAPWADQWEPRK